MYIILDNRTLCRGVLQDAIQKINSKENDSFYDSNMELLGQSICFIEIYEQIIYKKGCFTAVISKLGRHTLRSPGTILKMSAGDSHVKTLHYDMIIFPYAARLSPLTRILDSSRCFPSPIYDKIIHRCTAEIRTYVCRIEGLDTSHYK